MVLVRTPLSILAGTSLGTLCALALGGGTGAAAAGPLPCAPEATARPAIAQIENELDYTGTQRAVATHPLTVSLEFAAAANGSRPQIGQLQASGPAGVRVSLKDEGNNNELLVIASAAGAVPLSLRWVQGNNQCSATGQVTLQVLAPTTPLVSFKKSFEGGGGVAWRGNFVGAFRRGRGGDASPVRLIVRSSRPGTLRPPARGRVLLDTLVPMGPPASGALEDFGDIERRSATTTLALRGSHGDYRLFAGPRLPAQLQGRGYRLKVAFAVELLQSGRRIGAMSTGLSCRSRLLRGAVIVGFSCRAVGFRHQP